MRVTGIILAGGKSTRMGCDKVLLEMDKKTLLERAIELVEPLCQSVLISSNNPVHEKFGLEIIPDEIKNCGPMGGIYTCLKKSKTDWNFVISVDSAFVEPGFVQFLISKVGDFNAVVPIHKKGKEPLIAFYHKSCLPEIEKMLPVNNFKMYNLIHALNSRFVDAQSWIDKYPKLFNNLNRPEDLNRKDAK